MDAGLIITWDGNVGLGNGESKSGRLDNDMMIILMTFFLSAIIFFVEFLFLWTIILLSLLLLCYLVDHWRLRIFSLLARRSARHTKATVAC